MTVDTVLVIGIVVLVVIHNVFHNKTFLFLIQSLLILVLSAITAGFCFKSGFQNLNFVTLMLFIGMAFAFLGDLFMAKVLSIFPQRIINGIIAFSFTHACYIIAYSRLGGFFPKQAIPVAIIVYILVIPLYYWVAYIHDNPALSLCTFLYLILLTTMLWGSMAISFTPHPKWFKIMLFTGSLLFFISDAIVAYSNFRTSFSGDNRIIHTTYILGQLLIQTSPIILIYYT